MRESTMAGNVMGVQGPLGDERKDENGDADLEKMLRALIQKRIREIVRKKPGGGGYVLYAPNKRGKKKPKPVGEFPTKAQAKAAELQRFPPKDIDKLQRQRKQIEKDRKDPEKARDKELKANRRKKREGVEAVVRQALQEALFREDHPGSRWDDWVDRFSKKAVMDDKKFQQLSRDVAKKSDKVVRDAAKRTVSAIQSVGFDGNMSDVKHDDNRTYVTVTASDEESGVTVGPILVHVQSGHVRVELTDDARVALGKVEPAKAKSLRGELMTAQETLESDDTIIGAVKKRDAYLDGLEKNLDTTVADMSPLQVSILKRLLTQKYRGVK